MLLSNTIPSDNTLPGGSKVKGNVWPIVEQINYPFTKLISSPKANKVGRLNTHRRDTSLPNAKEINKGSLLLKK